MRQANRLLRDMLREKNELLSMLMQLAGGLHDEIVSSDLLPGPRLYELLSSAQKYSKEWGLYHGDPKANRAAK